MREEEKKRSSQNSSFKRFFKKRWVYPAVYIVSAAIILTAVLWFQNMNSATKQNNFDNKATDVTDKKFDEPSIEVNRNMENFMMPVKNVDSAVIKRYFYDKDGKAEEQEEALVFYNNRYHPNTGINIGNKDGESFDVVAALSGTVTKVTNDDKLLGNLIEIEHGEGVVTKYQSIKEIMVDVGENVKQGQVLAKAGESMFDEEAGVHVHFEIRKDGLALDPHEYFQKSLSVLQEGTQDNTNADDEKKNEDENASDEKSKEDEVIDKEKEEKDKEKSDEEQKEDSTQSSDV